MMMVLLASLVILLFPDQIFHTSDPFLDLVTLAPDPVFGPAKIPVWLDPAKSKSASFRPKWFRLSPPRCPSNPVWVPARISVPPSLDPASARRCSATSAVSC